MGSSGHEEGELGVFWAWVEGATSNMALAFEGLVEQVRSWTLVGGLSGLGLSSIMDTLNTLLIGWLVFVVLIVILSSFFYVKFVQKLQSDALAKSKNEGQGEAERRKGTAALSSSAASPEERPYIPPARKPTIVPDVPPDRATPPVATGADPDAANWANNIFTWLFNSADGGPAVRKIFLDTLNSNTVKTALETGILVEVMEIYDVSPQPSFSNMVVDCSPTDNITITCDCDVTVYLRITTTRTQKDVTTESEYACAVKRLRGRLNVGIITEELLAVVKFDGWPEVFLELEGIRNNAEGLEEQQVAEVIDEVVTSALRNSVYDVNFQSIKTFPRFRRARQAPERIIPVGYDSMPEDEDEYQGQPVQDLTALTTTATTTTATVSPSKSSTSTTQSPTITMSSAPNPTTNITNADGGDTTEIDERGRSRGNRRKRDSFFGTLKKRFSRSKVRSKSMEPGSRDLSMDRDMSVGRSISMERTANRASGLLAVPASTGGDGGSTRSSLSDASAISSSSTRTYVNEASTLIVETRENGVLKHYLIPLSLQQKSKWRKKGLKLHVFNEHTFVAKHMSSQTPCQVCQKTLGRRFGKQGYECRDCGFKCHKPCHVKTDTVCPNSTVNTMDLEYVKDPREERKAFLKKVKSS